MYLVESEKECDTLKGNVGDDDNDKMVRTTKKG